MTKPPKISIITPSFNQGRYIERTFKSVLGQGYPHLEYLVIDGGSQDETLEILKKYEKQLVWISEKDEGQSDAINKGARMATGDIIAYLNTDDTYEAGALKQVADIFAKDPSVMWLAGRCRIIDENDLEVRRMITTYKNFLLDHYSYRLLLITNYISQPATFWRREAIQEYGLFDVHEHLAMDYDYWLRIGRKHPPRIINRYLASFRVHHTSKTSSSFLKTFKQELAIAERYSDSRLINTLHQMHYYGMCSVYSMLALFTRIQKKT
jgi:glycosyltransferase involved in cell wall biosynthesis